MTTSESVHNRGYVGRRRMRFEMLQEKHVANLNPGRHLYVVNTQRETILAFTVIGAEAVHESGRSTGVWCFPASRCSPWVIRRTVPHRNPHHVRLESSADASPTRGGVFLGGRDPSGRALWSLARCRVGGTRATVRGLGHARTSTHDLRPIPADAGAQVSPPSSRRHGSDLRQFSPQPASSVGLMTPAVVGPRGVASSAADGAGRGVGPSDDL